MSEDETFFDEEAAIAELLKDGVLFANSREYLWEGEKQGETIILFVNCNDVFYWACADAENVTLSELPDLHAMWLKDKGWGGIKWCCKKRKMQPQVPMKEMMQKEGVWEDWMDALEVPAPS